MKRWLLAAVFVLAMVLAGVQCPVHGDSGAYFTGKTKTVDGVLLYEYKCPRGDVFWARP